MKRISLLIVRSLMAILIGSGTLVSNLHAQIEDGITASIPFPFTIGTQNLVSGIYRFNLLSSPFLLSVINKKTGVEELFVVHPEQEQKFTSCGRLIFQRCGRRNILSEVHIPGTNTFSELVRREGRDMRAMTCSASESTSIALR